MKENWSYLISKLKSLSLEEITSLRNRFSIVAQYEDIEVVFDNKRGKHTMVCTTEDVGFKYEFNFTLSALLYLVYLRNLRECAWLSGEEIISEENLKSEWLAISNKQ